PRWIRRGVSRDAGTTRGARARPHPAADQPAEDRDDDDEPGADPAPSPRRRAHAPSAASKSSLAQRSTNFSISASPRVADFMRATRSRKMMSSAMHSNAANVG